MMRLVYALVSCMPETFWLNGVNILSAQGCASLILLEVHVHLAATNTDGHGKKGNF
jgi:hypothetical protein